MNLDTRDCPVCGDTMTKEVLYSCENCQTQYRIDHDAEFIDGSWRDRSVLIPEPNKPTE